MTVRTAATSGAGPHTQPTFHPVKENVFPALETVSVRSAIPGRVQSGTCTALEDQVLVHLVGHRQQVVLDGSRSATGSSSGPAEDLAGRVVRAC